MINPMNYKTREEYKSALFQKYFDYEQASTPLKQIAEEELTEWSLENTHIQYAMQASSAVIPYGDYMILGYDRYNPNEDDWTKHRRIGEYAIYKQVDRDGHNLEDSLNYNADYKLLFVGEQQFPNMGEAICFAVNLLKDKRKENDHE